MKTFTRVCAGVMSALALGLLACADPPSSDEPPGADMGQVDMGPVRECAPPAGVSGSPQTIAEAVTLINALPRPTTLSCFLQSLDRPIKLNATSGVTSAQPAVGSRSPRLFLFTDGLILSVVPEGPGSHLLEFGELRGEATTLKGEIEFPVEAELSQSAPFEQIMFDADSTSCSLCHGNEEVAGEVDGATAYVSDAFAPRPAEHVGLTLLRREVDRCDREGEPERCAMFDAIFDWGPVEPVNFPSEFDVFFE